MGSRQTLPKMQSVRSSRVNSELRRMSYFKVNGRQSSEKLPPRTFHLLTILRSVWHPLRGPLVDWPLAVCDASTVDFTADTMSSDIVDPWGFIENTQIQHNPSQQWYYLRDQMPHELIIFKNADSRSISDGVSPGKSKSLFRKVSSCAYGPKLCIGTPHASFYNPNFKGGFMRESIEVRTLVAF
jgi:hypothetical protein